MPFQPFDKLLPQIRGGKAVDEITEAIQRTALAVNATGKAGKVVLALKFERQEEGQVSVDMDLRETVPVNRASTLFFIDNDGNLSRRDPRQLTLAGLRGEEEDTAA